MQKILFMFLITTFLFSSQMGVVYNLNPNGDGFLSIRTKPKGTKTGELYNGDKVKIFTKQGKWYKIKAIGTGETGWVHKNWIKITKTQMMKKHVSPKEYERLFDSIKQHDMKTFKEILSYKGLSIDHISKTLHTKKNFSFSKRSFGTPLCYAFNTGRIDMAKILIEKGADINKDITIFRKSGSSKKYSESDTCLIFNNKEDTNMSIIEKMVELGADVTKNNKLKPEDFGGYESPLFSLVDNKNLSSETVSLFLKQGADVDYGISSGITPLASLLSKMVNKDRYPARYKQQYETIKILLENGANPNQASNTKGGYTPMTYAASTTLDIIKLLTKYGGKLDTVTNNGDTMLHEVENISVAKYLIDNGLEKYINHQNNDGNPPIVTTFSSFFNNQSKDITKLLFDHGAILPKKNHLFEKLDFYTSTEKETAYTLDYAKILLKHGADINQKDENGRTALDQVLKYIDTNPIRAKIIYFLINNGTTYQEIHNRTIDNYFQACNNAKMQKLQHIMTSDAYAHITSEIKSSCKATDNQCIKKILKSTYGATNYKILSQKENVFYILTTDTEPKIIKLIHTENGISLGKK
ncbi:ankyrin repeat protein, putative [hydrothermal vent metagenome]|uniref:Ankyrin repeat protein, putative n=1 Tax=hydrothermal vent metagenome TaxID=652676 RepID=A0A1W1CHG2_9ZZZZ